VISKGLEEWIEYNRKAGYPYEAIKKNLIQSRTCTAEEFDEYLAQKTRILISIFYTLLLL